MRVFLIIIKMILIGAAAWLIYWLLYNNLVPSGRFEVVYDFKPSPFISALRPPERLNQISKSNQSCSPFHAPCFKFQEIIGDPVYFDLRLPSSFENVEITVLHKHKPDQKFTIAAFTDRKNWKFVTPEAQFVNPYRDYIDGLGLRANFSTAGLDIIDRTITFILGAPDALPQNPMTIYEIRAVATKAPIKFNQITSKILRALKYKS